MKHVILLLGLCVLTSSSFLLAQRDFNDYKRLVSDGGIPADFTSLAYNKILEDIKANKTQLKSSVKEKFFLEGIHYTINDLLHSGMVTYGDEVTMYVDQIASKLLEDDPKLRSELRFYTLKSNETNAFSTFQGIIFVTTGLISQLTSEAELAFILSHEIVHYTERHVVETFDWRTKNKINHNRIQELSNYSKEHEFEADKLALKRYHAAGYATDDVMSTFDVLLYSYLPFDEVELPKTYYNTSIMTIPEGFYPSKKYPIKAIEDADDSKSSHPNIKRRKSALNGYLNDYTDWQTNRFLFGTEQFNYIRNICRFESIRTDVMDGEFDDALYTIFILEKEFPNSIYLQRMKAKAWLGLAQFRKANTLLSHLPKTNDFEGEIARLHGLLRNLNKMQTSVVAMRMIEDLRLANPADTMINSIWMRMVKTLAQTEKFKLDKFQEISYEQALANQLAAKTVEVPVADSVVPKENEGGTSKYDKIKKKKKSSSEPTKSEEIDSSGFYLYALPDLLKSQIFLDNYDRFQKEKNEDDDALERYNALSNSERRKIDKRYHQNQLRLDQTSVIYVEPLVMVYKGGSVNRVKSEKLAEDFTDAIISVSNQINLNVITISSSRMAAFGTDGFNERALLTSYLNEITDNKNVDVFPTDFLELQGFRKTYGTDKVLFSLLEHSYHVDFPWGVVCGSILFYPALFAVVPIRIMKGNQTELSVVVLDLDQGEISGQSNYVYNEPLNKFGIKARVYEILTQVKSKPIRK